MHVRSRTNQGIPGVDTRALSLYAQIILLLLFFYYYFYPGNRIR